MTCEFTDTGGEIKNQIIQQCTNSRIRRGALRESSWKLADILDFGHSFETGNAQATEIEMSLNSMNMQDSHKATVNKVQTKKKVAKMRNKQNIHLVTTLLSHITGMAPARQEDRRVRLAKKGTTMLAVVAVQRHKNCKTECTARENQSSPNNARFRGQYPRRLALMNFQTNMFTQLTVPAPQTLPTKLHTLILRLKRPWLNF